MTLVELLDKKFDAQGLGLLLAMAGVFGIILVSAVMHYLTICVRGWPPQEECQEEYEEEEDAD